MTERTRDEIQVKGSVEACYAVATDFDAYPDWEKNTLKAEVRETDAEGRATQVWFEFDTPVRVVSYTLAYDHSEGPNALSFDLIEGGLREMNGRWTFETDGDETTVVYEMSVRPDFPLPGLIKRALEKKMSRSCVKTVRSRVEAA